MNYTKTYKNKTSFYNNKFSWISLRHANNVASALNGKFISTIFVNISTKHAWQCEKKHLFNMTYNSIYNRGNWCPECRKSVPTEMLDYKNKNNWYNTNKKTVRQYKPKKKSNRKAQIIQYIDFIKSIGVNATFIGEKVSEKRSKNVYIGIGIPTDRLYEYSIHYETDQKVKDRSKEKYLEIFGKPYT